jgi:hypothetical protein
MNAEVIRELMRRRPFEQFKLRMTNGEVFEVKHPELAIVMKTRVIIADPENDRVWTCSLLHVAAVESSIAA